MTSSLSRERLVALLERAQGKRVVVVGDAMLDVYLIGDVERISPEAPVPVVRVHDRKHALGGAANVAQNVGAIGARCDLVAAVGRDRGGETLRALLRQRGVGDERVVEVGRRTTEKTRVVARSQQLVRFDEEDDTELAGEEVERVLHTIRAAMESADALVLEDYNKGVLVPAVIREAVMAGIARGIPVIVDPKLRNFYSYQGATIFKPNRRELEAALGADVDLENPQTLLVAVKRLGVKHLLLTLGERGMALISATGHVAKIETVARQVYDVVGAGDTVTAYLATLLAAGATPMEAAITANIAAGIEVGKFGAVAVTAAEMIEYVDTYALYH